MNRERSPRRLRRTWTDRAAALLVAVAALAAAEARADDQRSIQAKARAYRAAVDGIATVEKIQIRTDADLARVLEISDRHLPPLTTGVRHWIVDVVLGEPKYRAAVEQKAKSNPRLWGEMVRDFDRLGGFDGVEDAAVRLKAAITRDSAVFKRVGKHLEQGLERLEREHPIDLEQEKRRAARRSAAGDLLAALGEGLLRTWRNLDLSGTAEATSGSLVVMKGSDEYTRCSVVTMDSYNRCNDACRRQYACTTGVWGDGRLRSLCFAARDRCYTRCRQTLWNQLGGCTLM